MQIIFVSLPLGDRRKKEIFKTKNLAVDSFLASSDFCCWLKAFANSLDTDQDRQNVGPDLDSNHL